MIERKHCHAGSHERDDEIFVKRVRLSEDGEVQEHDREEFAGFGEYESYIVDVGEGGVAEGGGEGRGYGDEG